MNTYTYTQSVSDSSELLQYVKTTLSGLQTVQNSGSSVILSFPQALSSQDAAVLDRLMQNYVNPASDALVHAANVSLYNSSSLPLPAAAAYTGTWEDCSRYSSIVVSVLSDQPSADGGVQVQFGYLQPHVDSTVSFSAAANLGLVQTLSVPGRWMRIVYTNNSTAAQTAFSLQTKWSTGQRLTTAGEGDTISEALSTQLTRAMLMGKQDSGTYVGLRTDESGILKTSSMTNTVLPSSSAPLVDVSYAWSVNTETNTTAVTAAGSVTASNSRAVVQTGASASSSATLFTSKTVSAQTARTVRVLASCSFTAGVTGSTQYVGIGSAQTGLFWGLQGAALGVSVRSGYADAFTPLTSFNLQTVALDPTALTTYTITCDGVVASFGVVSSSTGEIMVLHRVQVDATVGGPLLASAVNTSNTSSVSVNVARLCAYADNLSPYTSVQAGFDAVKSIASSTYVPVLSLTNRTLFQSVPNTTSMRITTVSISCEGQRGGVVIALCSSAVLSGSSFEDLSTGTSVARTDKLSTAMTGGVLLHNFSVYAKSDRVVDLEKYMIAVEPGSTLTLVAKTITSTPVSVSACINWLE